MLEAAWIPIALLVANVLVSAVAGFRAVSVRHPIGVTLAWLTVLVAVPFAGAALYMAVGERRLGHRRLQHAQAAEARDHDWLQDLAHRDAARAVQLPDPLRGIAQQLQTAAGFPPLAGNETQLHSDSGRVIRGLTADIEAATRSVDLLFYIWQDGGLVDALRAALIQAVRRGVRCRVLVDAVGSRDFLRGRGCAALRNAGVEVREALPVGVLRGLFRRLDLRNHRKLAVLDGEIAWTGSQNLADPEQFRINAGVGRWLDTMVRVRGPVVEALAHVFRSDWEFEAPAERNPEPHRPVATAPHEGRPDHGESDHSEPGNSEPGNSEPGQRPPEHSRRLRPVPAAGDRVVQVLPSGPAYAPESLHRVLLTAMFAARHELILTTPYFVPDEATVAALCSAAQRGVDVVVVIPLRVDSKLVQFASRAHFDELLEAGVRILHFPDGLLHAKTITVDGTFALLGSPNLDMRSFWLNFELSLLVYGPQFADELRAVQLGYAERSRPIELDAWRRRPRRQRLVENVAQLASPLL